MVAITHPGSLPSVVVRPARPAGRITPVVYRRRRLAVAGALLVILAVASVAGQLLADALGGGDDPRPVAQVSVTVAPGDTVWSIASELAPGDDPRPVVDAIVEANGGSTLVVGQRLDLALP